MSAKISNQTQDFANQDIIFENVSYIYGLKTPYEFQSLKNINLTLKAKKITAIIGSTGSGKSTLIQHINGLLVPSKGNIYVNGITIKAKQKKIKDIKALRRSIGLVFQFPEYQLFEDTIKKDIMFGPLHLGATKQEAEKSAKKYLQLVGLPLSYLDRSPFNLSGGQKRRVAIAGILAMEGHTLILDEPTAGLDPEGEEDFIKLFSNINKTQGKRIILVTHNMDHVLRIADEVVTMKKGEIIKVGTPFEVFQDQQLLLDLEIEPPKIYDFIYRLQSKGFDLSSHKIRSIEHLVQAIAKEETSQQMRKKRGKK